MVNEHVTEVIFVGLPGPTHHYSGLSPDNVAATTNRGSISNPMQAAIQAIELMRMLDKLGVKAAILPPPLRPHMELLREYFRGDDVSVIAQAARDNPQLLEKATSASAMWAANAATVTPSADSTDHHLHITTANLYTNLHRRIEAPDTHRNLSAIFKNVPQCTVHAPLDAAKNLRDEGAANHMRLSPSQAAKGLHVFVYGADGDAGDPGSARQTLSASRAVAAQHRLPGDETLFLRQNPEAIRQGVFHNDVIAVSNESVLFVHAQAYADAQAIGRIEAAYRARHPGKALTVLMVSEKELSIAEAVQTYVFNSQIVSKPDGRMALIAPAEAKILYGGKALKLLERVRDDGGNPIDEVHIADLRQSMRNGGGPACLRLRVPMTDAQLSALRENCNVLADEKLLNGVSALVEKHYPDTLSPSELGDIALYDRSRALLADLSRLMKLPLLGQ